MQSSSSKSSSTPLLDPSSSRNTGGGSRNAVPKQPQQPHYSTMRKKPNHASRNDCMSVRQVGATLGIVILLLTATSLWFSTLDDSNGGRRRRSPSSTIKEPSTPPDSLPSDPFAQYIYQEELQLNYDYENTAGVINPSRFAALRGDEQQQQQDKNKNNNNHRTIVVGDVHGSLVGFERFLKRIEHKPQRDTLVLAGDIVAKGPQSLKVVDRLIELQAKCVRGNHDDVVIRWRGFLDSVNAAILEEYEASSAFVDVMEAEAETEAEAQAIESMNAFFLQRGINIPSDLDRRSEHYQIARAMTTEQYNYLRQCPLILTIPKEISVNHIPVHVVHAGIDPTRDILNQRPWVLVNIRNLLKDGTPSRKKSKGRGWAREFNELHNRRSPSKRDFLVVYGHDAGRSLNVMPWSIGLDTGCVYGRELTGYVVETGLIVSSPCPRV
ncbi:Metallo-dependent phosphatase [Linnemannia elongata AG-77]|uniref:Metallo-dependent phosphatase n=1 Tax=Linnemannia elongata AG-77 TaxID=1314771 RepID=A0A197KCF0_9FUNG|nr:Metallo-dependent phosphatase [Linnemannia elongata AG-77]